MDRLFWPQKYAVIQNGQVIYETMRRFCGSMLKILEKAWRKALSASALITLICCKFIGMFSFPWNIEVCTLYSCCDLSFSYDVCELYML
jgi:hypothetical protein